MTDPTPTGEQPVRPSRSKLPAMNRPDDKRRWILTVVGIGLVVSGVYSHIHLSGGGEKVTLALIILGGLMVDHRIVLDGIKAVRRGNGTP